MEHSGVMEKLCTLIGGVDYIGIYIRQYSSHCTLQVWDFAGCKCFIKKEETKPKKLVQDLRVLGNLRGTF